MINGWFPKINARGEVASGNAGIWRGEQQISATGIGPIWLTDNVLIWNNNDNTTHFSTGEVVNIAYNAIVSDGQGKWAGWRPDTGIEEYQGMTKLRRLDQASSPQYFGSKLAWVEHGQSAAKAIVVEGTPVATNQPVMSYGGEPLVMEIATGVYDRYLVGTPTLSNREGGVIVRDGWVLTNCQGLAVRPIGSTLGYWLKGDQWYFPDFRVIDGVLIVVASSDRGEPRVERIPLTTDRLDLTMITSSTAPVPSPVPTPIPNPTPVPEKPPMSFTNFLNVVQRERAKYGASVDAQTCWTITNAVAADPSVRNEGWGLTKAPNGGEGFVVNGQNYRLDKLCHPSGFINDILGDTPGAAKPQWGPNADANGNSGNWAPAISVSTPSTGEPGGPPPPVSAGSVGSALDAKLATVEAALADAVKRIRDLEARPIATSANLPLTGRTIALRARANGCIVCADEKDGRPLLANRADVGEWEQFTILEQ